MLQEFKTNINCGSCVRSVTGFLDDVPGVSFWRVDTEDPRKVLSVEGKVERRAIEAAVREAGFDIELLTNAVEDLDTA
ncbi:MAG: heavy-metal-associated domain-containing protein [Bacteroidota bacterium]